MGEPTLYTPGGMDVTAGSALTVKIPARVFLGRMTGLLFDTDKTFLLAGSLGGIRGLRAFFDRHQGLQVLVVGHTDTVGSEQHNLTLSIERAHSITAYLQDDVDAWMEYYPGRPGSLHWGVTEDQHMLSELGFYSGPINGALDAATRDAVTRFQQSKGLTADGQPGQRTRRALVTAYMQIPNTTLPAGTVVQTHGCGEFHLAVPTADDVPEQRNRRVEVFFFEGRVDPPPRPRCPAPGCPEYPEWLRRTVQTFDLEHPPGALDVRVVDPAGNAVSEASVHASGPSPADGTSDGDGRVHFDELIPGSYTILAQHPGFRNGTAQSQVSPGSPDAPTLSPPDAGTVVQLQTGPGDLVVQVVDPAGNGIEAAPVVVQDSIGAQVGSGPTARDGSITFRGLNAGSYSVGAAATGFTGQTVTAQVVPNQPNPVQIRLAPATGNLRVHVVDNLGGPLANASVSVTPATGAAPAPQSTDPQGDRTFSGLVIGVAQISVTLQGFTPGSGSATVPANGTVPVTIRLTADVGPLDVHVTSSIGNAELTGVSLALTGPSGSFSGTTRDHGLEHFDALPVGSYSVRATLQDFATGTGTVQVRINQTNLLNLALAPDVGSVEVIVVDDLGREVPGASVTLTPPSRSPPPSPDTDRQGRIGFTRVPVGNVNLRVTKSGFQDATAIASVVPGGSATARITLHLATVPFVVRVVSSTGGNLVGAEVRVTGPASTQGATLTDGNATFNLPVGTFDVSASLDNFTGPAPQPFTLVTVGTNFLQITLTPNPVTATIGALPLVVVLKKDHCNPPRVPVRLGVTGTFTGLGTGRFTRPPGASPTVKFFTATGTEIAFNGTDNVFTAAQLTAGVQLLAEGANVSTRQEDTDLRLDLLVLTNAIGTPATGKATCIELILDLFQSRVSRADPAVMATDQKITRGRFIHQQDPGFHHGRAWLVVREVRPAGFTRNLTLDLVARPPGAAATGAVRLFTAELHAPAEAEVALPHPIAPADLTGAPQVAGSRGLAFFVEGRTPSHSLPDVQLQVGVQGGQAEGDGAGFTVVRFTNLKATIPSTQALVNRTGDGFANTPVHASVVTRAAAAAAIAAADFDESYLANAPIVMIENSLDGAHPVELEVTVQPAGTPVAWSRLRDTRPAAAPEGGGDANDVINTNPAPAHPRPTVTPTASTPTVARATMLPDSVGSFRVRAFVDEHLTGEFERDAATADSFAPEPYILMNFLLVRAIGVNNLSRANNGANLVLQNAAGGQPVGNQDVVSRTGDMLTGGPGAGHWARAVVNVIGGGSDGKRGLDRVFGAWIQNILPTAGSTAPGGNTMDWGADYRLTVTHLIGAPTVETHHQFILLTREGGSGGAFLPPPSPQPHYLRLPIIDATPPNAGRGGVLASGAGTVGPNARTKTAIPPAAPGGPAPSGEQWTVEFWDPPGVQFPSAHPGFAGAQMSAYRFNLDFQNDLCFWTNNEAAARGPGPASFLVPAVGQPGWPTVAGAVAEISGPGVVPDPACCLYATVFTNQWTVRLSLTFATTAPFARTVVTPFAVNTTPETVARIARPLNNLEVRFPVVHVIISFDATT